MISTTPTPPIPGEFTVRVMTPAEISLSLDWAATEGWNPGKHDAQCFRAADPGGFFIGILRGEPIGCISAVAYDDAFGFIGLYIVKPEFRGMGFGLRLWQHAVAYLGNRNIGLDGVVAQQANYRKSGFRLAYRKSASWARFQAKPAPTSRRPPRYPSTNCSPMTPASSRCCVRSSSRTGWGKPTRSRWRPSLTLASRATLSCVPVGKGAKSARCSRTTSRLPGICLVRWPPGSLGSP